MKALRLAAAVLAVIELGALTHVVRADEPASASESFQVAAAHATAPEFRGISHWLNSGPLTLGQLRGKVVLVDFWTYGCYNCVNTLPYVKALQARYGASGFTVVGIHTPEFPYEKSTANVAAAIRHHGITYPVGQDNDFATWSAYGNHYWPAQYIVDRTGKIVYQHAGEGQYDEIDRTIQSLLKGAS